MPPGDEHELLAKDDNSWQPAARLPFKQVMSYLTESNVDQAYALCVENRFRPRLGQLLIATGRLSAGDLEAILMVHETEELRNLPVGKLLVIAGMLSPTELRQYLNLQKMLRLPAEHHQRWGQKLVDQGVLTQEQLNIALNDRLIKKVSLKEAIVARGWMNDDLVAATNNG